MTPLQRTLAPLALCLACALLAAVTGSVVLAGGFALVAAASIPRAPGWSPSPPGQALLAVACAGLAGSLGTVLPSPALGELPLATRPLPPFFQALAVASLAVAVLRLHMKRPVGGLPVTLGLGLLVFLACGRVDIGRLYATALVFMLAVSFLAIRLAEPDHSRWDVRQPRHAAALAIVVATTAGLTFGLALALPELYARVNAWATRWVSDTPVAGFRDGPIPLGSLDGLLRSDEIVARVEDEETLHLRGAVYDRYRGGRWEPADGGSSFAIGSGDPPEDDFLRITFARSDADRFFVPVGASALHFEPADARINRLGIARLPVGERPRRIDYRMGELPRFSIQAPGEADWQVPALLAPALAELVEEWLEGIEEPGARARALELELGRRFAYSIDFERSAGRADPLLSFLLDDATGHCEYFASAMTLLSRQAGIPARLVTGYRVAERNPVGDYFIVRERHAHAWSELYLPGRGWVTFDPSPAPAVGEAAAERTPILAASLDLLWVTLERHGRVGLLVLLVAWFVAIQMRRLWTGRSRRESGPRAGLSGPPRWLDELLSRLAGLATPRATEETLERYAARIARDASIGGAPPLEDAGDLLRRYAALRYGDEGDGRALERDVRRWLEASTTVASAGDAGSASAG